jgi:exopolyphosphatase / guanosine-5'-triphosphate,3'-diphosphate pyrophosphatase
MRTMHVAVVDVGSNTIRLLVGAPEGDRIAEIVRGKRVVGLGADVERSGAISAPKLAETVECVAGFVEDARDAGAELIDVVIASPGRQARNAPQLIHLLSRATQIEARVLSREDEARLAFEGALAGITPRGAVAVCDVGGGSAQVAIGTVEHGPAWLRSVDLGSLRLSARIPYGDPPSRKELAALRLEARAAVSALTPPLPGGAFAVGGTARSLRKLVGPSLGPGELDEAFDLLRRTPAAELAGRFDIDLWRARALPAGTAIVAALQDLLGVPLAVGRGGLREGVALELLDQLSLPAVQAGGR